MIVRSKEWWSSYDACYRSLTILVRILWGFYVRCFEVLGRSKDDSSFKRMVAKLWLTSANQAIVPWPQKLCFKDSPRDVWMLVRRVRVMEEVQILKIPRKNGGQAIARPLWPRQSLPGRMTYCKQEANENTIIPSNTHVDRLQRTPRFYFEFLRCEI